MNGRIEIFDPRAGGEYRIVLTYDDGAQSSQGKTTEDADVVHGPLLELVPNQKIVQSVQFDSDDPRFAGEMVMTWLLTLHPRERRCESPPRTSRLASRPPTTPPASPQPSPTWRPSSKANEVFGPRPDGRTENARGV